MKKLNIVIIFGGKSTEHSISLISAASVMKNMDSEKYNIIPIGITKEGKWLIYNGPIDTIDEGKWFKNASTAFISPDSTDKGVMKVTDGRIEKIEIDAVFPVLHGMYGEDGTIQGLFELCGIPYVGCGVLASAVGMDKIYTKLVFEKCGIPQANYCVVYRYDFEQKSVEYINEIEVKLGYPCFIKPSNSGSSVGISKANNAQELEDALAQALKYDRKALIEEFIDCREIECAVLGNEYPEASVLGEILPANEFYDFEAKYENSESRVEIPAKVPEETYKKIQEYAVSAYKGLDCMGLTRVDFFVHKENGKIFINEVNTLPGFTNISMYPQLWEKSGVPYSELIDRLIELALKRDKAY